MSLFIITGISMGIGKGLFDQLSKSNDCIGTTTKKNKIDNNIFYYSFNNFSNNSINWKKLSNRLNNYKKKRITIFLNAAIYDKKEDNLNDKQSILNINFF